MTPHDLLAPRMTQALDDLRRKSEPFAIATIVRTAGATAAKPGAKAVLRADGSILHGWLGGACTTGAVAKVARQSIRDGTPQMVSIAPEDVLQDRGATPGETRDGVLMARNGCPSQGTVDVFVDPWVPRPELVIIGQSPVATALAVLAHAFDWDMRHLPPQADMGALAEGRSRAIVVATQGQGDLAALSHALDGQADHIAFVGSRRKYATLAEKLLGGGADKDAVASVRAPAGLDIGAVTCEEIALSILAELTQIRRTARV